MACESSERRKLGLNLVYPKSEVLTNSKSVRFRLIIIAIHGLDTHSERTFQAHETEGDEKSRLVHWLRDEDMLPSYVPFARVYTYDWNSATTLHSSSQYFHHHAQEFLRVVSREQQNYRSCPIIFIGSCFGGLVLAKALCLASTSEGRERETLHATQGVVFLGTPFRGSGAASATHIRTLIAGALGMDASSRLIKVLQNETGCLAEVRDRFASIARQRWQGNCRVACFFETRPTKLLNFVANWLPPAISGFKTMVLVDSESATLSGWDQIGLNVSHSGLSKFRGPDDENFLRVAFAIQRIIEDEKPDRWYGTGSSSNNSWDAELEEILTGDGFQQEQDSSRSLPHSSSSSSSGKKKAIREHSRKVVGTLSLRKQTQRIDETSSIITPEQQSQGDNDGSVIPDLELYLEPYRRVPRIPTPPTDDLYSTEEPDSTPRSRTSQNVLLGALGIAVGAAADSLFRSRMKNLSAAGFARGAASLGTTTNLLSPGVSWSTTTAALVGDSEKKVPASLDDEVILPDGKVLVRSRDEIIVASLHQEEIALHHDKKNKAPPGKKRWRKQTALLYERRKEDEESEVPLELQGEEFRVECPSRLIPGTIIKVPWPQIETTLTHSAPPPPAAPTSENDMAPDFRPSPSQQGSSSIAFSKNAKFRRLVVIARTRSHYICVTIKHQGFDTLFTQEGEASRQTSSVIRETFWGSEDQDQEQEQEQEQQSDILLGYPAIETEIFYPTSAGREEEEEEGKCWVDYATFSYVDFHASVLITGRVVPQFFDTIVFMAAWNLSFQVKAGNTRDNTLDEYHGGSKEDTSILGT